MKGSAPLEVGGAQDVRLMTGNEACAFAALAVGMRFYAGYPITPSSEIAEVLSRELPKVGGVYIQMEDEIASIGAIIGASLAGTKSMTATSGPGFSLMQENIGYAAMTEVPIVVVNVMRGGPSTGLPTMPAQGDFMQARWGTHGDHPIVVVAPNSVHETYHLTVRAFNISEEYRVPAIVLLDEGIAHVHEKIVVPNWSELTIVERPRPTVPPDRYLPYEDTPSGVPPMADIGSGYRYHVTGLVHDQTGFPSNRPEDADWLIRRLHRKIDQARDRLVDYEVMDLEDAEIGIVAYGSTSRACRYAVRRSREAGVRVGMFRPRTVWPFPDRELREYAERIPRWLVVEMSLGQLKLEVERALCGRASVDHLGRVDGNLVHPTQVLEKLEWLRR